MPPFTERIFNHKTSVMFHCVKQKITVYLTIIFEVIINLYIFHWNKFDNLLTYWRLPCALKVFQIKLYYHPSAIEPIVFIF